MGKKKVSPKAASFSDLSEMNDGPAEESKEDYTASSRSSTSRSKKFEAADAASASASAAATSPGEGLSEDQIEFARKIFAEMDEDGSGTLEADEIHKMLESLGVKLKMKDCEKMVALADADGNGALDFDEVRG